MFTLMHVINPSARAQSILPTYLAIPHGAVEIALQRVRAAERYLDTVAERLRSEGANVETRLVIDPQAATAILAEAHDGQDTLITLATHGRSGMAGSIADKVIRGADVPVLVYRLQEA